MRRLISLFLVAFCAGYSVYAGTTGKIAGKVVDAETGEPLPGANVIIEGTQQGAATDLNGYFVILNVKPGTYTVHANMIGYTQFKVSNVRVNIDLTTTVNFEMRPTVLAMGDITVVAERPVVVKDVSASQVNIQKEQVENLPVRRIEEVIDLQAGVVGSLDNGIQIRGGDQDETAFLLDGITFRDERNNIPYTSISLSSVEDIQIQTGGFSAEYGNIRSGIIHVVTREGNRSRYSGTVTLRYSPVARKNFGPSGYDPSGYWSRPFLDDDVAWTGTDNWDENTQRQYPSFEGWNSVSERTLQDDDPDNDLTPQAAQQVWKWEHRRAGDVNKPDYTVDLGFGGPVPFIGKNLGDLRFFYSHRQEQDAYLIRLSRDTFRDQVHQLKLTSNISPTMKLTLGGFFSQIDATTNSQIGLPTIYRSPESVAAQLSTRSFIDAIMWVPDYYAPTRIRRYNLNLKLTHTLSSRSYYEVRLERQSNKYQTYPRRLRDTETIVRTFGENYGVDEAPFGFMPYPSSGIAGMRMGVGMSNARDSTKIYTTGARFDLTTQMTQNHLIKTGVELVVNKHEARFGGVDITLPAGRPQSRWDRTPVRASYYLQDKIEFEGLIANLGARLDYSDPGGQWYSVAIFDRDFYSSNYSPGTEEQFEQANTQKQLYLSPRLGISHPITENSKLFFNYGHFYSMPEASRLYLSQRTNNNSVQIIGDPNLKLSRTKAYEIGFEQNLFNKFLLRVTGYYKNVDNQPNLVQVVSSDSKVNYSQAEDNFFEDIRGIEFSLEKRFGSWLTGFMNYTYLVEKSGYFGKLRLFENPAEQRAFDRLSNESKGQAFKPKPRPFFNGSINIRAPKDFGPSFAGMSILGDWYVSFLAEWRAGSYTTWTRGLDSITSGIRNNVQLPDYFNMDLRLTRSFDIGGYEVRFFLDVNNLLNTKIFNYFNTFVDGNDLRDYLDSLLWPKEIGGPLGYQEFGDDSIGDLRPDGVAYDALEPNPNNDASIAYRNQKRRDSKSYIDNPNLKWLYYLNPRDVHFGFRFNF